MTTVQKTWRIDAMPKGKTLQSPQHPADFADYFTADNEADARKQWDAENEEYCGGDLYIVRVTEQETA